MKIQSTNITAVNTNMASVQQKAQLSAEALQAKSVESGPSFSQRISDGFNGVSLRKTPLHNWRETMNLGLKMIYIRL